MIDFGAFFAGLTFFDASTVLPLLLSRLGASPALIGLTQFIMILGFTLPALFGAHYIHGQTHHKRFLLITCYISRTALLTLPPVLLLWGQSRPGLALVWFFVVYTLFWSMDGATVTSWFDIVAKAIPARVRGRFFGTMQTVSGLAAIGSGYLVKVILSPQGPDFPANFALLAALWCAGMVASQVALHLIREPPGVVEEEEKPPLAVYLRQAPSILRRNRRLLHLILTRLLVEGAGLAAPFYILFAGQHLPVAAWVGIYAMLKNVGAVCAGPLWGWTSDRFGPTVGLKAVAGAILVIPALALLGGVGAVWVFPALFFLMGGVQQGVWMVASGVLLESVDARERPLALGVTGMFQAPTALYGVLGGLLAQATSYPVVFGVTLAVTASGFVMALRFPRRDDLGDGRE